VTLTANQDLLIVFIQSSQVFWTARSGAIWTAPAPIEMNALTGDPVALAALPNGRAVTAFRGLDGKLYASRYNPMQAPPWSTPAGIATPNYTIPSSPALAPGTGGYDAEMAFIDSATGAAYHSRLLNSSWSPPSPIGGTALTYVALTSWP
jgi:hypothetical protein